MPASPDATLQPPPSRPARKDEIELHDRGLYIESWLPERRSRRKPLLLVPGDVREPTAAHLIREVPELFGPSLLGWATLPEKLQRDHRDLNLADVLRIQHLMGQKPHESGRARRTMLRGVRVDPSRLAEVPRLVIGGGFDRTVSLEESERLATWLDAEFEPFGAHSHYGLILGEEGYGQVAESIRGFLEAHRL